MDNKEYASNEQTSLEGLYNKAVAEMNAAVREDEYLRAATRFYGLRGYKDASDLESKCRLRAEKLKNDGLLDSAKNRMKSNTADGYREALKLLVQVKKRLETKDLIAVCEKKINEIERHEQRRKKLTKILLITVSSILAAVVLLVGGYIINPMPTLEYKSVGDGMIVFALKKKNTKTLEIPAEVDGKPVVGIGASTFEGNKNLKSVSIPSSVKTIGKNAFKDCSHLEEAVLSEGLENIADGAFEGCSLLQSIEIPASVVSIGNFAFAECGTLKKLTFYEGLRTIGDSAFSLCSSVSVLTFPESLISIGSSAFSNCFWLTEVVFPGEVESIGDSAFSG